MTYRDNGSYVRFPEKVKTDSDLGSAARMVEMARAAAEDGKEVRDEPAVTRSQDAFAAAETEE